MCGRFVAPDVAAVERFWQIDRQNWHESATPRFNVAPTTCVPMLRVDSESARVLDGARWGLIPPWWKKDEAPTHSFNARSEEAAQKPMWRHAMRHARCLLPARGWYEWSASEQVRGASGRMVKQPWFIHAQDAPVLAFAGLWSLWEHGGDHAVLSCAILTRVASSEVASIHDRMPVVLEPEQHASWLNPTSSPEAVGALMAQSRTSFEAKRVSTRVNNVRNNDADLLEPVRGLFD